MHKKKVILSFDYELFFGDRSGTVQKTLTEPTNQLLDVMDSVGLKGNFFVDWQMLKYLALVEDERTQNDYSLIVNQLKDIIRRGHRIELHIHPHWVDAKYNGDGTWNFDEFRHYSLQSFAEEEVTQMFVEGTELLTNIARDVDPNYRIVAFRAGGWAIQPFMKIKKGFLKSGIKIDSSVAFGAFGKNQYSFFDFMDAPNQPYWHFENDVCTIDMDGSFIEVPIASYHRNFFYKGIDLLFRKLSNDLTPITDGTHYRSDLIEVKSSRKTRTMMSMSRLSYLTVAFFSFLNRKELVTLIDHPKDYTPSVDRTLKILGKYCYSITYEDLL